MMKKIVGALLAPAFALGMSACTVDQTEEGELPEVNVEEGQMPEYDVDAADVDVGLDTQTVTVPDVDINAPNDTTP